MTALAEVGYDFGELDVELPEVGGILRGEVGPEQVPTFTRSGLS